MAKPKKKRPAVKPNNEDLLLSRQDSTDNIIWIILLVIIALVPLITRMVIIPHIAPTISGNVLDTGMRGNAFTYLKMNFLILLVSGTVLAFLYKMIFAKYRIKPSYINIPTAVLLLLILLSVLFASYSSVATTGTYTRHEGALAYLMYLALFFIAANIHIKPKYLDYLVYAFVPIVFVNAILGLLAFYGINILNNPTIQAFAISPAFAEYITEGSLLSTTINNPNYVSGIASVIFVIFLTRFLFSETSREVMVFYVLLLFTFAMLLTATSTSGFLTLLAVAPFVLVPAFREGRVKPVLIRCVGLLASLVLIYILLNSRNQAVYANTLGFSPYLVILPVAMTAIVIGLRYKHFLKGLAVLAVLILAAGTFYFNNAVSILPFNQQQGHITESINPVHLVPDEDGVLSLPSYGVSAGSGRVHIWAETLNLLIEKPLLGYGLDTLGYYYPHYDLSNAANVYGAITDKPHNMYLALAFGSGIPALLAFLLLVALYLQKNLFLFSTAINDHRKVMTLGILAGCLAYLCQGLFNDSIIGTAPLFWIMLGIGVSLTDQDKRPSEKV